MVSWTVLIQVLWNLRDWRIDRLRYARQVQHIIASQYIYIEKNTFNIEKFLDIFERIRNFGKFSTMAFRNTYANTLKKSRLYLIKQVKQDPF